MFRLVKELERIVDEVRVLEALYSESCKKVMELEQLLDAYKAAQRINS